MPRFRFRTLDATQRWDEDMCDLPDVAAARTTAIVFVSEVLREVGGDIYEQDLRVVVTNEAGLLCWDLRVSGVEGPGAAAP